MLMKWEDLEPGDVLIFTKEIEAYYRNTFYTSWVAEWCNKELTVSTVVVSEIEDSITVSFTHKNHCTFPMKKSGDTNSSWD